MAERPSLRAEVTILEQRVYRGPNFWAYDPCVRMLVDLGSAEEWPTDEIPGFTDRLFDMLPGLSDHTCSSGEEGGFRERVERGTWLGHVAEHIALQLQVRCGHDVSRGKTRGTDEPGQYNVIYAYYDETIGRAAGTLAIELVNHLIEPDPELDVEDEIRRLIKLSQKAAYGPSTQAILDEASLRDIPWMRLDDYSLVQLGQGVHAKRIRATMTSNTSALAVDIASDKETTTKLLDAVGIPTPRGEAYRRVRQALRYADHLGWPVVVKPLDGNHGRGVHTDLKDEAAFEAAFADAQEQSKNDWVVVEKHIVGRDYRFLIVDGTMVACAERVPAHVIGDGTSTVEQLVEKVNADERRGFGHEKVLTRIVIDRRATELLAEAGHDLDSVPADGEFVRLALTGNMSTGGTSIDRTAEVHPDNVEIAEQAAMVVGLDIAGIDFIAPDITQPVREDGGAICEVNAAPGFRMHTHPTEGEGQFVARPVLDMLFPAGAKSRIPITAVTGTNGKTTTARMLSHILKGVGVTVGMTSTNGIVIDERLVMKADASGPRSARMVLQNPAVEHAVLEIARGGLLREGLAYERNDVAIVTNVASDHLGRNGIDTLEDLAYLKQIIVEAVPRDGFAVLNADDPLVVEMARVCDGDVVFFSLDPDNEHGLRHVRRGGRFLTVEQRELGEMIVYRRARQTLDLVYTHLLPSTFEGRARMNVLNAMAAAGAALVHDVHLHHIRQGLRSFNTSYAFAPGRLNVVEVGGFQAIVDYCHNAHGMRMLGDFVERTGDEAPESERGERVCVAAVPGDRRDEDMVEFGQTAARYFDRIIVREDDNRRGRDRGEVAALIETGIRAAMDDGARCRTVETELGELASTRHALSTARRHDIVVFCSDDVDAVWQEVQRFRAATLDGHAEPSTLAD